MKIPGTPRIVRPFPAAFTAAGLIAGLFAKLTGYGSWADFTWAAVTVVVLIVLLFEIVSSLARQSMSAVISRHFSAQTSIVFGILFVALSLKLPKHSHAAASPAAA